jgi:hypothetical protein
MERCYGTCSPFIVFAVAHAYFVADSERFLTHPKRQRWWFLPLLVLGLLPLLHFVGGRMLRIG